MKNPTKRFEKYYRNHRILSNKRNNFSDSNKSVHVILTVHREAEFERVVRDVLQIRKNLQKTDWPIIDYHISKRKRTGEDPDVYFNGRVIPRKKVRKEINRNKAVETIVPPGGMVSIFFKQIKQTIKY